MLSTIQAENGAPRTESMTAYFDTISSQIRQASTWEELEAIDRRLMAEIGLATMQPDFPTDLAVAVDTMFLQWSVSVNCGLISAPATGPASEVEDVEGYRFCLGRLESELHSIFHERAHRDRHMGDNPLTWYHSLLADVEERRENLAVQKRGENPAWRAEQPK